MVVVRFCLPIVGPPGTQSTTRSETWYAVALKLVVLIPRR
jgi:hypothetical protein